MPHFGSKRSAAAFSSAFLAASALLAAGCAKTSPAVGTWTDSVSVPGSATAAGATLTLAADGTGTVSVPPVLQNRPVTWKAEDKTVTLSMGAPSGAAGANAPSMSMPATLSDDGKTMTLQFPMKSIQLTKSEATK